MCTRYGCKTYPVGYSFSTTGPNLSSIALGVPAPVGWMKFSKPLVLLTPDAFMVLVTPQVAFQLPLVDFIKCAYD